MRIEDQHLAKKIQSLLVHVREESIEGSFLDE